MGPNPGRAPTRTGPQPGLGQIAKRQKGSSNHLEEAAEGKYGALFQFCFRFWNQNDVCREWFKAFTGKIHVEGSRIQTSDILSNGTVFTNFE